MKKLYKVKKHGEVVDAFIPARKSKKGYRFGFVRFTTLKEAEKAIAQMNGCVLYGSRLVVRLAKFSDNLEDRLCKQLKFRVLKNGESSKNQSKYIGDMSNSPRDSLKKSCLKRIQGHVEEEAIKKLKMCFIGKTTTRYSTSQVEERLLARGLKDVSVKFMGGCSFLINLNAQELSSNLHLHEWAILKEAFSEVNTWSDLFYSSERTS
ncbi:hypothetical protein V6N13_036278 [Hibiscus sabdariffa]